MNRSHDREKAIQVIIEAQIAGISNISLDLIYGLPEHLKRDWKLDINQAIELNIPHISAYNLTVENRTALFKWVEDGKCIMPEQEICKNEHEILLNSLEKAGYQQYEISNFSKAGYRSRHNTSYWGMTPYIGIGPSAHSYDGKRIRKWNVSNNQQYIKMINEGNLKLKEEQLTDIDVANELILLGTRTIFGVSIKRVLSYLEENQKAVFLNQLETLKNKNYIFIEDDRFYVYKKKRFLADYIARELIILPL